MATKGVKGRQVLLVRVLTTRLRLAGRVVTTKNHGMRDFVDKRVQGAFLKNLEINTCVIFIVWFILLHFHGLRQ